jgi:hypothetical protein
VRLQQPVELSAGVLLQRRLAGERACDLSVHIYSLPQSIRMPPRKNGAVLDTVSICCTQFVTRETDEQRVRQ